MKKAVLTTIFSITVLIGMAQTEVRPLTDGHRINRIQQWAAKNNYQYMLTNFCTNDMYQFCDYSYNGQNQLIAVKDSVGGDYSLIDSLFYNGRGQMIRMSGWQLLNGRWENVYYIDYTYDQAGNIASRTNYNNFGSWVKKSGLPYTHRPISLTKSWV